MVTLEETSAKVNALREEYDREGNEVLKELIGSMLGHAKVGETFEIWYGGWHENFINYILEDFTRDLNGRGISSAFTKEDLKNMYERLQKGVSKRF